MSFLLALIFGFVASRRTMTIESAFRDLSKTVFVKNCELLVRSYRQGNLPSMFMLYFSVPSGYCRHVFRQIHRR